MPDGAPAWKWFAGPITGLKCGGCDKPLYLSHDGGLVSYDNRVWHVACVLDKLPEPSHYAWMAGG
jgi:hypothetical protein